MSGWNATAVDAAREEQLVQGAAREELILLLKAISLAPTSKLSADDPLRKIHHTDINIHFTRQKNYDLNSKINASATAVGIGVHPRWALQMGAIAVKTDYGPPVSVATTVSQLVLPSFEGMDSIYVIKVK